MTFSSLRWLLTISTVLAHNSFQIKASCYCNVPPSQLNGIYVTVSVCILNRLIWFISHLFWRQISFYRIQLISSPKSIEIWISPVWSAGGKNPFLWQEIHDPHWVRVCAECVFECVCGQWNTTQGVWGPSISSNGCWWYCVSLSYRLMTLKSSLTSSWHQVSIGWAREGWWIDEWPAEGWMDRWTDT